MTRNDTVNNEMPADAAADLELMAFCYLTDELSSVDHQAFELRLATEQPAREALARAVSLMALRTSPVVEVAHTSSTCSFDRWMRTTAWLAIASAACLAVMIGLRSMPGVWTHQEGLNSETALVWIQVRDAWPDSSLSDSSLGESLDLPAVAVSADTASAVNESAATETEVEAWESESNSEMPDWLLTAVVDPAGDDATEAAGDESANDQEDL